MRWQPYKTKRKSHDQLGVGSEWNHHSHALGRPLLHACSLKRSSVSDPSGISAVIYSEVKMYAYY